MDINAEAKKWALENSDKSLEEAYVAGFIKHADFAEGVRLKKEEKVKKQKQDFYNELIPFLSEYGKDMIRAFYNHFSQEIQPSNTNILRFKPNSSWNTKSRLDQWQSRNFNSAGGFVVKQTQKDETPSKKYKEIS